MTPEDRAGSILQAARDLAPAYGFDRVDPALILAQAAHETGGFDSSLIRQTNNAFGLKHPKQRPTKSIGATANNYATFSTLRDGVEDYLMRQKYFRIPNTSDPVAYVDATFASGYAEDPAYKAKWLATYGTDGFAELPTVTVERAAVPLWPILLIGGAALFARSK
jgi:flagellum-specific peptidoglycan hydrolase FlgJ